MRALFDMRVRDLLRTVGGSVVVGAVFLMPVWVALLQAKP